MIEDGENPDEELSEKNIISPWYIRKRLSMSQREFADTLGVPVATLRNWEQNRVAMEQATIALMRILAREPESGVTGAASPRGIVRWATRCRQCWCLSAPAW
jgi:putative transcriptional regulator